MSYLFPALGTFSHLTPTSLYLSPLWDLLLIITETPLLGAHLLQNLGSEPLSCRSPQIQGPCEITLLFPPSLPSPKAKVLHTHSLGIGSFHCIPVPFSLSGPNSEVTWPLHPTVSAYESLPSAPTLPSLSISQGYGACRVCRLKLEEESGEPPSAPPSPLSPQVLGTTKEKPWLTPSFCDCDSSTQGW